MEVSENNTPNIYKILKGTIPGGILINLICTPSDVVKNYWYYNKTLSNDRTKLSTIDVVKHIHRKNGPLSFWIGLHWSIPITVVGHAIFLYSYDSLKNEVNTPVASLVSRLVAMVFVQPLDCMRTYSQANLYGNKVQTFTEVTKSKGFLSLYKGSYPTLIRDIPFSTFHWPINEYIYRKVTGMKRFSGRERTQLESIYIPFISGTFSSIIATVFSHPFDIIKTNIQAAGLDRKCLKDSTVLSEFKRIKKNYGIRGFFIGIGPRMFKVVPGSAIMSAAYYYYNR